jgi:hypothetical protein
MISKSIKEGALKSLERLNLGVLSKSIEAEIGDLLHYFWLRGAVEFSLKLLEWSHDSIFKLGGIVLGSNGLLVVVK